MSLSGGTALHYPRLYYAIVTTTHGEAWGKFGMLIRGYYI